MMYRVSIGRGLCCVRSARSVAHARTMLLREVGTNEGVSDVREATKSDIEWFESMGGRIEPDLYAKKKRKAKK